MSDSQCVWSTLCCCKCWGLLPHSSSNNDGLRYQPSFLGGGEKKCWSRLRITWLDSDRGCFHKLHFLKALFFWSFSWPKKLDSHQDFPLGPFFLKPTQPPTVACKMEAQSEYVHIASTFLHVWRPICVLTRCLSTKFLHRSSGGSLIRVHCWLGTVDSTWNKTSQNALLVGRA